MMNGIEHQMSRKSRMILLGAVLLLILAFVPMVAAKSFIIQDNNGNPVLIANGTTNNVGIGTVQPGSSLVVNGQTSLLGNLNMNTNNITNLRNITGYFAGACPSGEVVQQVKGDGTYQCVDVSSIAGDTDDQNLSEVLVHGNVANQSINMSQNNLIDIANLYGDTAGTTSFFDASAGSDSERVSGIQSDGTLQYSSIFIGGSNIQNDAIDTYHIVNGTIVADDIASGAINTTHILNGEITSADIQDGTIGTSDIGSDAIGNNELINTGNFNVNSISVQQPLTDGNISDIYVYNTGDKITGNLNFTFDANITNVRQIQGFFGANCGGSRVVERVWSNGTYKCTDINAYDTDTDDQGLPHVLTINNTANQSIDMDGYGITGLGSVGNAGSSVSINDNLDFGGVDSLLNVGGLTGTGIVNADQIAAGAVNTTHVLDGTITAVDLADAAVTDNKIAAASINRTQIEDGEVTAAEIAANAITQSGGELDSSVAGSGLGYSSGALIINDGSSDGLTIASDQLQVNTGTGITLNGDQVETSSNVPLKNQQETVSAYWTFNNNLTVTGDLNVLGNITNTDVSNLSVNGSLLPPEEFPGTFDVGASGQEWKDAYFTGTVNANTFMQGGTQVLDTLNSGTGLTIESANGNGPSAQIGIAVGGVTSTEIANGAVNETHIQNFGCSSGQVMYWTGNQWGCTTDDSGTDNQQLGTSGNKITLDNSPSIFAPFANNSDKLDGVELVNINWGDVAMAQSDISVSDLGAADANINMNSKNITNLRELQGYFSGSGSASQTVTGIAADGTLSFTSISVDTANIQDGAVTNTKIANGAVNGTQIQTGAVGTNKLANGAVTRAKIAQDGCSDTDVLKWNGTSSAWECEPDADTNTDSQNLADVLSQGNQTGGRDIDMQGASVRSSSGEICIGDMCT